MIEIFPEQQKHSDIIDGLFYYFSHGIKDFSEESVETLYGRLRGSRLKD